ncbi:unnamed protein product [Plutella xylostella]|uniref:(diamondback moth) hypothetical protein n=1 Tax=Plutella xylostella TaxID=51655 RepID=A0A8S4EU64_PLUXY|nr:unnamed protein product [Plutella xylostella]
MFSNDSVAPDTPETLQGLQSKHPPQPPSAQLPDAPASDSAPLQVLGTDVYGAIMSFRCGSAGGLDGLSPQHLKDLLASTGQAGETLLSNLTALINLMLAGKVNTSIAPLMYGARLCALNKKDGGIRPIAVGSTLRRIASKVCCRQILPKLSTYLQPLQLGFGSKGGCEAAVHALRTYIEHDGGEVVLKVDIKNAFNSIDRGTFLTEIKELTPEIYPYLWQCYSSPSYLIYNSNRIHSEVGCQQGDPLGPAIFSLAIHKTISSLKSKLIMWYLDDGTLGGESDTVLDDLRTLTDNMREIGLELNSAKDRDWLQASLPIRFGGIGVRKVSDVALPAFLSSTHSTLALYNKIIHPSLGVSEVSCCGEAKEAWQSICPGEALPENPHSQRLWDEPKCLSTGRHLLETSTNDTERARLLATAERESGLWLHALPSPKIGTFLDDRSFQTAIGLRLGIKIVQPHHCICGAEVNQLGHHGLSCRRSAGRLSRHAALNDILRRALVSVNTPAVLEPAGVIRDDGKRPDGMSLIPWAHGRSLVWDATCVDTLAASHVPHTSRAAGAAAGTAENLKREKYRSLDSTYLFLPFGVETMGPWGPDAKSLVKEITSRLADVSGDKRAGAYLRQRLSLAIQRGNVASMWEREHAKGEEAELRWCEWKGVQQTTLRVTYEAKYQLKNILTTTIGFPEECCIPQRWNPVGPDPMLDLVIGVLCMGLYPNVCLHQGKRKVLTTEGKPALIHKTSVNCSNQEQRFPSPFFVFGEKVRTRAISCKQTSMVAPLHLLLFGSRKVEWRSRYVQSSLGTISYRRFNCWSREQRFPSPFFVFGEKVRTRAISCKQTSMVAPLHLLLFGSRKVEWSSLSTIYYRRFSCWSQEQRFPSPFFVFGEKVRTRAISCKQTSMAAAFVVSSLGPISYRRFYCWSQEQKFPSPFFVFGEKVRTRAISCKQTSMVAPLHLLLFGSRKVEWVDGVVRLDNWVNLAMDPGAAAAVTSLRPAVERLLERAAAEPDAALQFTPAEQKAPGIRRKTPASFRLQCMTLDSTVVGVDSWVSLAMDPGAAAAVTSLRPPWSACCSAPPPSPGQAAVHTQRTEGQG